MKYLAKKCTKTAETVPKSSAFLMTPTFSFITMVFRGAAPFKIEKTVQLHHRGRVPSDVVRGISHVIRHVLAEILDDPTAHQRYAYRLDNKNAKREHLNLPVEVIAFLKDFTFASFGYPPALRFPGYTLSQLPVDSPTLASKLGNSIPERQSNYSKLLTDTNKFDEILGLKLQRALNELRRHTLTQTERMLEGMEVVTMDFIKNAETAETAGAMDSDGLGSSSPH